MPREALERRKKGFGMPIASWLREFPKSPPLDPLDGIDCNWVGERWSEHRDVRADYRLFLWSWLGVQYHLQALHGRSG